ncbi:MAG: 3-oxoacyl-ACP synthase III family protein [Weeksellaceae bacterium]|nr:3-oxoacyl-ACP synthase III family protein [Weeksellaceae bacterium]MDX9704506.1 3-oxoacyl-ACP synthase III family protein [Weeksellaceae bacterium]
MINTVITGSGHFLPEQIVKNSAFLDYEFYDESGEKIEKPIEETIQKFQEITEIEERRYADNSMFTSDLAVLAAQRAIENAGINKDELDYVIVANNYGDIDPIHRQVDSMPSIATRVKHKLEIKNNHCRPYDMLFGCPGWIEGLILAHHLFQSGTAKKALVIGADTLSRAVDPHDRTAMIFADGAGAVVLEAKESDRKEGIISYDTLCDSLDEMDYLMNSQSLKESYEGSKVNIKMRGRKVYEYALRKVPALIKRVIDNSGLEIGDIDKILLHQANAKMDHAMIQRLFKLYGIREFSEDVAPMTVQKFGNSSVATVPTMYDLIARKQLGNHEFKSGNHLVFGSVGAGMNINAIVYKIPLNF